MTTFLLWMAAMLAKVPGLSSIAHKMSGGDGEVGTMTTDDHAGSGYGSRPGNSSSYPTPP